MTETPKETIKKVKYMDIAEFISEGYLQEVNRHFLHPLGLALEVRSADGVNYAISGVWDYRDDPEGIRFERVGLEEKARNINRLWKARKPHRMDRLGYMVQPVVDVINGPRQGTMWERE